MQRQENSGQDLRQIHRLLLLSHRNAKSIIGSIDQSFRKSKSNEDIHIPLGYLDYANDHQIAPSRVQLCTVSNEDCNLDSVLNHIRSMNSSAD